MRAKVVANYNAYSEVKINLLGWMVLFERPQNNTIFRYNVYV